MSLLCVLLLVWERARAGPNSGCSSGFRSSSKMQNESPEERVEDRAGARRTAPREAMAATLSPAETLEGNLDATGPGRWSLDSFVAFVS